MASSIDDLALAYAIMAQPDPENRGSALFPNPALTSDLATGGKKYLGICEPWINRADADVRKMFDAAVAHYIKAGYERVNIVMPYLPEGQKAHALTILSEVRSGITPEQISKLTYPNQLLLNVAGGHATAQDFLMRRGCGICRCGIWLICGKSILGWLSSRRRRRGLGGRLGI
jgi:Asp-tRNA(Asn)/Glu-tRNA(Gln) amidotransferase A subunit family amidase